MIEVRDLVKWFGPTLAVDHLNFKIDPGRIVGFLGPNGAGKSTTLRILTGYLPPSSGQAFVAGHDVLTASRQARACIGYLPEHNPLYPEMRVEEYLDYRGRLFRMDYRRRRRIEFVIDRCGLTPVRRRLIGQLSRGNRQRVGLAQALLHDPPILILDEPTAGLDPNQVTQFRQLLSELRNQHTILLSTHVLPEVEKTADYVLIIAAGRIVAQGSPAELRRSVAAGSRIRLEVQADAHQVRQALDSLPGVGALETVMQDGWCLATVTPRSSDASADLRVELGRAVASRGWILREMRFEAASLEEFFVQITAAQSQAAADTPSSTPPP